MWDHITSRLMKWGQQAQEAVWLEFWKSGPTIQVHLGPDCSEWQMPVPGVYQGTQFCNQCHHLEDSHQVEPTELHWTQMIMFSRHWDWGCFLEQLVSAVPINIASFHSEWLFLDLCLSHKPHLRFVDFTRTDFDRMDYLYLKVCGFISLKKFPHLFSLSLWRYFFPNSFN